MGNDLRFSVIAGGVGPVEAAVRTALVLAAKRADLVVCVRRSIRRNAMNAQAVVTPLKITRN